MSGWRVSRAGLGRGRAPVRARRARRGQPRLAARAELGRSAPGLPPPGGVSRRWPSPSTATTTPIRASRSSTTSSARGGRADDFYLGLVMSAQAVLDVGCGTGTVLRRARAAGHGGRLVGLDPAAAMLDQARTCADVDWMLGDLGTVRVRPRIRPGHHDRSRLPGVPRRRRHRGGPGRGPGRARRRRPVRVRDAQPAAAALGAVDGVVGRHRPRRSRRLRREHQPAARRRQHRRGDRPVLEPGLGARRAVPEPAALHRGRCARRPPGPGRADGRRALRPVGPEPVRQDAPEIITIAAVS